jgi:DNA mismatch repair protein MutS
MSKMRTSTKSDCEDNIYGEYFKLTKEYQQKYGKNTVVLMQVGSFLEVYGIKTPSGDIIDSKIKEFSEICQFNIAEKKNAYGNKGQIIMAGFMVYLLDKYLPKIMDSGYTAVVYLQEKELRKDSKSYNRILYKIYSPGTFISCDTDSSPQITNNIMCIWIHTSKPYYNKSEIRDILICGISIINIFTGKSYIFEYQSPFLLNNTTFDELERFVSVYNPSEVLFISPFQDNDIQKIIQYSGINTHTIHYYNTNDNIIINCENQQYIKQILSKFFNEDVFYIFNEFSNYPIATQSFCFLLNFIQEHNPDLVRKISLPDFNNTSKRLILANHTLMQLNIIDDGSIKKNTKYSSVISFLNKCCSAIGKRKIQYQITNPTFDIEWLSKEYKMISIMLQNYNEVENIRNLLCQIRDIEKIIRQIILKKIYPSSIAHLYNSINIILFITKIFDNNIEIQEYLCNNFSCFSSPNSVYSPYSYVSSLCENIMSFLDSSLDIENCKKTTSMTSFDDNIIKIGISEQLDKAISEKQKNIRIFNKIKGTLNLLMQRNEGVTDTDFIRVHETEKSGNSLQITTKRSQILKSILEQNPDKIIDIEGISLDIREFKFSKTGSSSSNMDIEHPVLNTICKQLLYSKDKINTFISESYLNVLNELERTWLDSIEKLSKYVGNIDVLQCKAYLAKKYNYCSPIINNDSPNSYVSAFELRHCLIEHIQQNEIYVTNDISLGVEQKGILLYGTNAVGKTSLIRSLGIAIIMAQAGMYVPCSNFVYKPYTAIFSRILGNDNIFKGLSSFAVEMSELRVILKMSDENSLILGDEVCKGTESESAISIFLAALIKLYEKKSSFIFATHLHEITNYNEILERPNICMKHMAVNYNRYLDCLLYDRKLRDGSGPNTYGLEVCKSLYLEQDFLELAYSIRNKYYPENRGELSNSLSRYNSNKIKSICELCKKSIGSEIHHLEPQENADENGYIGSFHKNHTANLISICQECHDSVHKNDIKMVKRKTTKGFTIVTRTIKDNIHP